jgi:hypothetical protein
MAPPSSATASPGVDSRPAYICMHVWFDSTWYADLWPFAGEELSTSQCRRSLRMRHTRLATLRRCGPWSGGQVEVFVDSCHFFSVRLFVSNAKASLFTIKMISWTPCLSDGVTLPQQADSGLSKVPEPQGTNP